VITIVVFHSIILSADQQSSRHSGTGSRMLIDFIAFSFFAVGLGIATVKVFERGNDYLLQRRLRDRAERRCLLASAYDPFVSNLVSLARLFLSRPRFFVPTSVSTRAVWRLVG
jgi:hypothetical protein